MSMFRPLQPHTSHVMQHCELPGLRKCAFCGLTNLQDDVELPCGHSDREAETSRLTARIAELEKAQQDSSSALEAIVLEALGPYGEELTIGQRRMLADVIAREFRARTTLEASERGEK